MTARPDLEAGLADLATALDAPSGAGIPAVVIARLRAEQLDRRPVAPTRRGRMPGATPRRPRKLVVLAAVVSSIVGGALAGPAVADWLGVRGVEVRRPDPATPGTSTAPPPPTPGTVPQGASLDLGTAVPSLAAAEAAAGFAASVPSSLGPPDAVWVDRRGAAPFISLFYADGPLITQFDATLTHDAVVSKMARPGTIVEQLHIRGEPAMWIDGVHEVAVRARDGEYVFERLRLSDKVLLVQHGELTVRIETPPGLGRDDAIRIAESLPR